MWWQAHLSEFVTLFLVINPFAALPVFMALTSLGHWLNLPPL